MTLEEAIKHIDEVLESSACERCKREHLQLKEWLLELKMRREKG